MSSNDKSLESNDGDGAAPTEEDLDSDVGTIFTDEEGGKQLDEDEDDESDVGGGEGGDSDSSLSSDSDDCKEKCPICLQRFSDQDIGTPEMCEHNFCLRCITAWSKKVATCPIDRKFFSTIIVKKELNGSVVRLEEVQFSNSQAESEEYDSNPTYCEVCGRCDREDRLLLCDGCDLGYHLECLEPPMEYVPMDDWFCPNCASTEQNEVVFVEEIENSAGGRGQAAPTNRIPRTMQNERILQSIELPIQSRNAVNDVVASLIASSANRSDQPSTSSAPRRSRTTRRRSRRRSNTPLGDGRRRRRRRRKTKRKHRVATDKRPHTARGRIAQQLGIRRPLPGQILVGLPHCKTTSAATSSSSTFPSTSSINSLRYSAGIPSLRLFGGPLNDLSDLIASGSDEEGPVSQPASFSARLGANLKGPPEIVAGPSPSTSSSCDVLGGILKKQYIMLHDKNMKIARGDGTLVPSISQLNVSDIVNNVKASSPKSPGSPYSPLSPTRGEFFARIMTLGMGSESGSSRPSSITGNEQTPHSAQGGSSSHSTNLGHTSYDSSGSSNSQRDSNQTEMEFWVLQNPQRPDDDDFDIYSDIEEQPSEDKTESNSKAGSSNSSYPKENSQSGSKPRKSSHDSEKPDDPDSDCGMVIDEDEDSKSQSVSPQKSLDTSVVIITSDSDVQSQMNTQELLSSPENIPLPSYSPPRTSKSTEESKKDEKRNWKKQSKKEYDPSEPLDSSDEDEHNQKKRQQQSQAPPPVRIPPLRTTSTLKKTPALSQSQPPGRSAASRLSLDSVSNLSSVPSDEGKRPAIHFSIPKRHNLLPISSLLKRQKGVMKKEVRVDQPQLNFQSEITKVFGADSQGDEEQKEEPPRMSLIAEIFGSDDEEDEIKPEENESVKADEKEPEKALEIVFDMNSGRWKTVSQEVEIPLPPEPVANEKQPTNNEEKGDSDLELEIIEIVSLHTNPPRTRNIAASRVEKISDNNDSDIEVIDEVQPPKRKVQVRKEEENASRSTSGSRSPQKKRERKRRHSSEESAGSYFEEGEIVEGEEDKRKKRRERKRRLKKRRLSKEREYKVEKRRGSGEVDEDKLRKLKSRLGHASPGKESRGQRGASLKVAHSSRLRRSRSGSSDASFSSPSPRSSSRHNRHRSSVSPRVRHSRSPSHSPEPIRPRSSLVSQRKIERAHNKKLRRHLESHSRSPNRKSKYSKSAEAVRRKRSKLRKIEKAAMKAKRKAKERLKERERKTLKKAENNEALLKSKEKGERKRKRREKSLSPVKAIVADGDSIVVSLSFQKEPQTNGKDVEKSSKGKGKKASTSRLPSQNPKKEESKSIPTHKNLDLGTEDLSSTSESSGVAPRDAEMGASKVSSSGDGSGKSSGRFEAEHTFSNILLTEVKMGKKEEAREDRDDLLVTSTRDSLEPAQVTEDEITSPTAQKVPDGMKLEKNVSSSAISPRVQLGSGGSSGCNQGTSHSQAHASTGNASMSKTVPSGDTQSSTITQPTTSASITQSQMRYQAQAAASSQSILANPVLAVANALFAARLPPANTLGGMLGEQLRNRGAFAMLGKNPNSREDKGKKQMKGGDSPLSPNSTDGDDLFEPPAEKTPSPSKKKDGGAQKGNLNQIFTSLFGNDTSKKPRTDTGRPSRPAQQQQQRGTPRKGQKSETSVSRPNVDDVTLNEDFPGSAVELSVQEKLLKKLNRQERVVEEVKLCLKPHYIKKHVNKEEYKEILRRAVPKICHSKTGDINPMKVRELVEAYVKKFRHGRKKAQ